MENLYITWETILAIFGGLAIIAGGVKIIITMFNPFKILKAKVDKHGQLLENDNKRICREEDATKAMLKAMLALIDHAITNNSIEQLKRVREELRVFIAER